MRTMYRAFSIVRLTHGNQEGRRFMTELCLVIALLAIYEFARNGND